MNKEQATEQVRLFPSTRRRIKAKAARADMTMAEFIDVMTK